MPVGVTINVTWLVTLGVGNRPWVVGTSIYEGVKLERKKKILKGYLPPLHPPPSTLPLWLAHSTTDVAGRYIYFKSDFSFLVN